MIALNVAWTLPCALPSTTLAVILNAIPHSQATSSVRPEAVDHSKFLPKR